MVVFASLCGLPVVVDALRPVNRAPHGPVIPALPGDKELRDPYGTPNVATSDNFAVHWGDEGGVTTGEVDRALAAFELAWQVQVVQMGHGAPYGTDSHLFNVYIGDSGAGAPPGYGTGGYYFVDPQGWPMVVISAETLDEPLFADHASSHEFYHAVQGATERFAYDGGSAWFTEATAEWAAIETDPENPLNGPFVFAYGLLPELPLNFFDYPDTGVLEEYYQYGAFVFPAYAADVAGFEIIRDTWADPGTDPDPIEVMRALLDESGHDFDELFLDHVARNATWDYPQGELYAELIDAYGEWYEIDPVLATYSGDGTGGVQTARGNAPRRYGYNAIELRRPITGILEVRVTGEDEGTLGSRARFGARVVQQRDDGTLAYHPVPFDDENAGELQLEVDESDHLWLMVGAWTRRLRDDRWEEERFHYDYELLITEPPADVPAPEPTHEEVARACGCASGAGATLAWVPLLLLASRRTASSRNRDDRHLSRPCREGFAARHPQRTHRRP